MIQSVTLKNGKCFKIPEGYRIEIVNTIVDNQIDEELIKYNLLIITNMDDSVPDENIRERCYMLSDVLSYGDDIEGCP
jgi:hypothetical protein